MRQTLVLVCILVLTSFTGTAAAANNTTSQATPGGGGDGLDIGEEFKDALTSVLMDLVEDLAETLDGLLVRVFVSYPDVTKSWVLETHQKVFRVSLALASAAAVWIGVMHMFDRIDGVRPLISLLAAVAFGAVAPDLLYYPVELSRLTTEALAPTDSNIVEVSKFTFELLLVLFIDVLLLLGTVMLFIARDFYLMLGVALAPLIALMAVTSPFQPYAKRLTDIWIISLLIGPLDVVVLDLTQSLMGSSLIEAPHYLYGLAGIALLFGLPVILLGAGAFVFAPMSRVVRRGTGKVSSGVRHVVKRLRTDQDGQDYSSERNNRRGRRNRFRNQRGGD